ncbi:unnamed protein product, partial [marine sediment metagenome]
GRAVGNALEVKEAIETLRNGASQGANVDFREHSLEVASHMLTLAGAAQSSQQARVLCEERLADGSAWEQFCVLVESQGGDVAVVDDPSCLPAARLVQPVLAPRSGFAAVVDARVVGMTSMALGAGRAHKDDAIDYGVGVEVLVKVGDRVEQGDPIFVVHANLPERLAQARESLLAAVDWSAEPLDPLPLFYDVIR